MWILRNLFMLCVFSVLFSAPSYAQEQLIWHYAWQVDSTSLIAFTLSGEVRGLGLIDQPNGVYRIDDSRILYVTETDTALTYWVASPDEIRLVWTGTDERYQPTAYHYPYVVFAPPMPRANLLPTPSVLLNLETGAAVEISTLSPAIDRCCVFSANGNTLRYVARTETGIELRERVLASGEETIFYTLDIPDDNSFLAVLHGSFGDFWLVANTTEQGNERTITYQVVDAAGAIQTVGHYIPNDPARHDFRIKDTSLISWQPFCEADCTMTTRDLLTDEEKVFAYDGSTLRGIDIVYLSADNLVLRSWEDYSLRRLNTDSEPEILGYWAPQRLTQNFISRDGRWSILLDDPETPQGIIIWNHAEPEPIYVRDTESNIIFLLVTSHDSLLVARDIPPYRTTLAFNTLTGQIIEWTPPNQTTFIALSDSEALVFVNNSQDEIAQGIYFMTYDRSELNPLVSGRHVSLEGYPLAEFNR